MKQRYFLGWAIAAAMAIQLAGCATIKEHHEKLSGFKSLFDGKTLTGWEAVGSKPGAWKAEGGMISVEGGGGWLRSDREYGNFKLRLDFRLTPAGNSGVFLRAPIKGDGAYQGMEIQILDHFHDEYQKKMKIHPEQYTGSIYDVVAAKQEGLKAAGEWNHYEITADGTHIVVVLNGHTITDADTSEHLDRVEKHPGLARKSGYVGLQAHETRVDFRNISIKELP